MNKQHPLLELAEVIKSLRDPEKGCPWDKEQTHSSLKPYVIEEACEVADAVDLGDQKLCEELGDLLLQIYLHSQIASERKAFDIAKVAEVLSAKLIRRHPHVFGNVKVSGTADVVNNWEEIKRSESSEKKSALGDLPRGLPALLRAQKLGERVSRVGLDWWSAEGAVEKALEELEEFLEEKKKNVPASAKTAEELGDLLFTLAQVARKLGMDAESVLQQANLKFSKRFSRVETLAGDKDLRSLNAEELDKLWNLAKSEQS